MPSEVAHPAVLLQAYLLFGLRSQVLGQTLLKGMAQDAKDRIQEIEPSKVFDHLETIFNDVEKLKDTQGSLSLTDRILLMFEDELKQKERDSTSENKRQEESDSYPSKAGSGHSLVGM